VKIKLDENIGRRGVDLLRLAGHDVMTVRDQNLQGARDETLFPARRAARFGSSSPAAFVFICATAIDRRSAGCREFRVTVKDAHRHRRQAATPPGA
jgi:hypothetical protein